MSAVACVFLASICLRCCLSGEIKISITNWNIAWDPFRNSGDPYRFSEARSDFEAPSPQNFTLQTLNADVYSTHLCMLTVETAGR